MRRRTEVLGRPKASYTGAVLHANIHEDLRRPARALLAGAHNIDADDDEYRERTTVRATAGAIGDTTMRVELIAVEQARDGAWHARIAMDGDAAIIRIELHEPGYSCWFEGDDDPRVMMRSRLLDNSREEHALVALVRDWGR